MTIMAENKSQQTINALCKKFKNAEFVQEDFEDVIDADCDQKKFIKVLSKIFALF